jgi:hypothetical protein
MERANGFHLVAMQRLNCPRACGKMERDVEKSEWKMFSQLASETQRQLGKHHRLAAAF